MKPRSIARSGLLLSLMLGALSLVAFLAFGVDSPLISWLGKALLAASGVVLILWLLWKAARIGLWRVGRRLAFSYFLIGVMPIPMVGIGASGAPALARLS